MKDHRISWVRGPWEQLNTSTAWERLLDSPIVERTNMPAKAIQHLDCIDSIRAVCQQCSWSGGPGPGTKGNAQDHARAFGHTTVLITMTLDFYTPAPGGTE